MMSKNSNSFDDKEIFCENCKVIKIYYYKPLKSIKCKCESVEEEKQTKNILDTNPENRINLVEDLCRWKSLIPKIQSFNQDELNTIQKNPNIEKIMNMIAFIITLFNKFKDDFMNLLHFLDKKIFFHFKNFPKLKDIREFLDEVKFNSNGEYNFSHVKGDPKLEAQSVRLGLFLTENDANFGENKFLDEISFDLVTKFDSMIKKSDDFLTKIIYFIKFLAENKLIPYESYNNQNIVNAYENLREKINDIVNPHDDDSEDEDTGNIVSSKKIVSNNKKKTLKTTKLLLSNDDCDENILALNEQIVALTEMKNKYETQILKLIDENKKLNDENKNFITKNKALQDELDTIFFQVSKISQIYKKEDPKIKNSGKSNDNPKFKLCLETLSFLETDANKKKADAMEEIAHKKSGNINESILKNTTKNILEEKLNASFLNKEQGEVKKLKEQLIVVQEILYNTQQDYKNLKNEIGNLDEIRSMLEIEVKHYKDVTDVHEKELKKLIEIISKIYDERPEDYENYYGSDIQKPELNCDDNAYQTIEDYIIYVAELDKFYYRLHKEFDQNKEELESLKISYDNLFELHKKFKNEITNQKKNDDEKHGELKINYLELESKMDNFLLKYEALEKDLIKEKIKNAIFNENLDRFKAIHIKEDLNNIHIYKDDKDNNNSFGDEKDKLNKLINYDKNKENSINSTDYKKVIKRKFINEYERCLKELEEKQIALIQQKENYENEINSLKDKISNLQSSIKNSQLQYDEFLDLKNKYFDDKLNTEENFINMKNELSFMKKKERDSKDYILYVQKQIAELRQKLKMENIDYNTNDLNLFLLINGTSLTINKESYKNEVNVRKLQDMIKELLDEKDKFINEAFKFYDKYESVNSQKKLAMEECDKMAKELKNKENHINALNSSMDNIDKLKVKIDQLEGENTRLKNTLEKKKEELISEINTNENVKSSLIVGIDNDGDDLALLKSSNLNLNLRIENLGDSRILLETENNYLKKKINYLENLLQQEKRTSKEFDNVWLENLNLKCKNLNYLTQIKILKNDISTLKSKLQNMDLEYIKLKSDIQANENSFNKNSLSNIYNPANFDNMNNSKSLNISNDNINFDYNMNYNIIKDMKIEKNDFDNKSIERNNNMNKIGNLNNYVYSNENKKPNDIFKSTNYNFINHNHSAILPNNLDRYPGDKNYFNYNDNSFTYLNNNNNYLNKNKDLFISNNDPLSKSVNIDFNNHEYLYNKVYNKNGSLNNSIGSTGKLNNSFNAIKKEIEKQEKTERYNTAEYYTPMFSSTNLVDSNKQNNINYMNNKETINNHIKSVSGPLNNSQNNEFPKSSYNADSNLNKNNLNNSYSSTGQKNYTYNYNTKTNSIDDKNENKSFISDNKNTPYTYKYLNSSSNNLNSSYTKYQPKSYKNESNLKNEETPVYSLTPINPSNSITYASTSNNPVPFNFNSTENKNSTISPSSISQAKIISNSTDQKPNNNEQQQPNVQTWTSINNGTFTSNPSIYSSNVNPLSSNANYSNSPKNVNVNKSTSTNFQTNSPITTYPGINNFVNKNENNENNSTMNNTSIQNYYDNTKPQNTSTPYNSTPNNFSSLLNQNQSTNNNYNLSNINNVNTNYNSTGNNSEYLKGKNTSSEINMDKINQIVKETTGMNYGPSNIDISSKFTEIDKIYLESLKRIKNLDKNPHIENNSTNNEINSSYTNYKNLSRSNRGSEVPKDVSKSGINDQNDFSRNQSDVKDIMKKYTDAKFSNYANKSNALNSSRSSLYNQIYNVDNKEINNNLNNYTNVNKNNETPNNITMKSPIIENSTKISTNSITTVTRILANDKLN